MVVAGFVLCILLVLLSAAREPDPQKVLAKRRAH